VQRRGGNRVFLLRGLRSARDRLRSSAGPWTCREEIERAEEGREREKDRGREGGSFRALCLATERKPPRRGGPEPGRPSPRPSTP